MIPSSFLLWLVQNLRILEAASIPHQRPRIRPEPVRSARGAPRQDNVPPICPLSRSRSGKDTSKVEVQAGHHRDDLWGTMDELWIIPMIFIIIICIYIYYKYMYTYIYIYMAELFVDHELL